MTRMKQDMKQTIRFFLLLTAFWFGAASEVLAQFSFSNSDITITGTGTAVLKTEGGIVSNDDGTHTVALTITPGDGYYIRTSDIVVEKLVDPSQANAPRRAVELGTITGQLTIEVTDENGTKDKVVSAVSNPTVAKYTFTVPADYNKVKVTAAFQSLTDGGYTRITSSTTSVTYTAGGTYILLDDVNATVLEALYTGSQTDATAFTGTFEGVAKEDGSLPKIIGSSKPLFYKINGGKVKNVIFERVGISVSGDAGAVCCTAVGAARIYNCGILPTKVERTNDAEKKITGFSGSSVSGSGNVGSLVGTLSETARVINCFSYANVSGGTVGGIVGNNTATKTTSSNLGTMVMNCMFYGDITSATTSKAPIYNGTIISNAGTNGVGNYNYFWTSANFVKNLNPGTTESPGPDYYNCALMADTRYLQRFEFFRHLLNSHRELAGWWATGTYSKSEMMKWVLEPSQLDEKSTCPFPILKAPGYYPSVVNIDAENAPSTAERNKGGRLGTLSVSIRMGSGAVYGPPTGATITRSSLTLNITDKAPDHFNFNYYKVQLPYYNDVGTKNYNGNRVVAGWKIVSITGGTAGSYSTGEDVTYTDGELTATPYNFADRNCTNKDLYSVSKRVFNQGAYWDVPYGVTAITIEPYWAKCAYLADAYADVVYNTAMTSATNVPNVGGGQKYTNGNSYSIAGENQKVFTSRSNAISSSNSGLYQGTSGAGSHTVYDYAVVLVGNYHHYGNMEASNDKPYTVTSVDLDGDNEPDYSYILRFDSRNKVHPVRVDFINIPGLGMAQKSTGGTGTYNFGIMQPKGWFESTNTSLFRETQFEYDSSERIAAPYILQGGVMEQWVNGQSAGHANKTTYFHVGGNVWFKEFHRGTHQDQNYDANHSPVSVTGGDFDQFHLTGLYRADANIRDDNAECYITGGRFGVVAGTGMDGIGHPTNHTNGNITWIIDNADIKEFYAGSFNADKPAQGNLHTIVNGGHIDLFCGGPKFGDMSSGKTVTTTATGCTFGTFFGAGYGGNSYSRQAPRNHSSITNFPHTDSQTPPGRDESWNSWLQKYYKQEYDATYGGVSTQFSYQFLPMSDNKTNVARIFIEYVKFSLAKTRNVTSKLTGCTIGNFYGGGSLGKVDGDVTSTLTDCTVTGSVYGAGYSATIPPVEVMPVYDSSTKKGGFYIEPRYNENTGAYIDGVLPDETTDPPTTTYTWQHSSTTVSSTDTGINKTDHILYTNEDLTTLGTVTGQVTLNIEGTTTVGGSVYGGGAMSDVQYKDDDNVKTANTQVNIKGGTITNDVYGGGMGETTVVANDVVVNIGKAPEGTETEYTGSATVNGSVYGGSAFGAVNAKKTKSGTTTTYTYQEGKTTKVNVLKGTVNGSVFGGGLGQKNGVLGATSDIVAEIYGNATVTIGAAAMSAAPTIAGSVFGGSNVNGISERNATVTVVRGSITGTGSGANFKDGNVHGGGLGQYTLVKGDVEVNIGERTEAAGTYSYAGGATVYGDVYGGSALGNINVADRTSYDIAGITFDATKTTKINLYKGTVMHNVYGGALGQRGVDAQPAQGTEGAPDYVPAVATVDDVPAYVGGDVTVELNHGIAANEKGCAVLGNIFGGNNANGSPKGNVTVHVYGTQHNGNADMATKLKNANADLENLTVTQLKVILTDLIAKATDLGVTGTAMTTATTVNGKEDATVAEAKTAIENLNEAINDKLADENTSAEAITAYNAHTYDVKAVYGGGNEAPYVPVHDATSGATTFKTQVIIEGCDVTSIGTVYGGGNAAAVPETNVHVNEAYEIGCVFGGGNGKDATSYGENPGADVGVYKEKTGETVTEQPYGTGDANTLLRGGYIHEAYGGSNQKGNIKGKVNINTNPGDVCNLNVEKLVGAGKNADIEGDLVMILGCKPTTKTPLVFGGADNADVNGNVELTITSGTFGQVFGGNNLGGVIKGHIKLNIEETGCTPINIDELYLGGNQAAYSVFGYKNEGDKLVARSSLSDGDLAYTAPTPPHSTSQLYANPVLNVISCTSIGKVFGGGLGEGAKMYADPTVNINMIPGAFTGNIASNANNPDKLGAIGDVFGGGNAADVYGNTTINIGTAETVTVNSMTYDETTKEYTAGTAEVKGAYITGNVYGGGNLAGVGQYHLGTDADDNVIDVIDMVGNTFVNIGAVRGAAILDTNSQPTGAYNYTEVDLRTLTGSNNEHVYIAGNVYGGGKGEAISNNAAENSFRCGKAMVTGGTNVCIGNGTVNGTVYGGGEVGRVEENTRVTIGIGEGVDPSTTGTQTSRPEVKGSVFGAGAGVKTHGYSALVRGHSYVTVEGNAKIGHGTNGGSVYGGGEIASVGRYNIAKTDADVATYGVEKGMPYSLKNQGSGYCYVTVQGYAEIGRDNMQMKADGGPDDSGYVFGGGKGILPYDDYTATETPWREGPDNEPESYDPDHEADYLKFIETLALTTHTYVTIDGHAFIKGSVYGGSENGHVQQDTDVKIQGHCQIGNGWNPTLNSNAGGGVNERYNESWFINPATASVSDIETNAARLHECAHWDYGKKNTTTNKMEYLPYDKNGSDGGATTASDGHTFFGNVFGGGSGLYPYKSRVTGKSWEWLRSAGRVYGNTSVEITGGHILTSVYGGCELTDVGNGTSVETDSDGKVVKGKCKVKMSGGTLGVPRTLAQIAAHPVTCYLFGAGKGDQRTRFNQWTNVGEVTVEINDSVSQPIIYGSVFGGGEDGHVLGNAYIIIGKTTGGVGADPVIGTWGTSYVEGNVFGAGRGFGGDALTAGVVCGNVDIKISAGKLLGSIYGGGRLGSVGTYLVPSNHANYGKLIDDGKKVTITDGSVTETTGGGNHGHVTINISGGTIGNDYEFVYPIPTTENTPTGLTASNSSTWLEDDWKKWREHNKIPYTEYDDNGKLTHTKGGNVFTGGMGRRFKLDGITEIDGIDWKKLGNVKSTKLTISNTAQIKSNVYGGGELGAVIGSHKNTTDNKDWGTEIIISGGTIGNAIGTGANKYYYGSVFGGGMGTLYTTGTGTNMTYVLAGGDIGDIDDADNATKKAKANTKIAMSNGTVKASVYGGGELAQVYGSTSLAVSGGTVGQPNDDDARYGGASMGNVYGGGKGSLTKWDAGLIKTNTKVEITGSPIIYHNIYGGGAYGSVGTITTGNVTYVPGKESVADMPTAWADNTGKAIVYVRGGTIGSNGNENGMVFGSSRGDVGTPGTDGVDLNDRLAWVKETEVEIGTSGSETGPAVKGSVYGSGENGHVFAKTDVKIYSGKIGIDATDATYGTVAITDPTDNVAYVGANYPKRGNVYGGGCGEDTYPGTTNYNPLAGIVHGNANVTISENGHVVHNVYGAGALGSVDGTTTVTINGGRIGDDGDGDGNVYGAARGKVGMTQAHIAQTGASVVNINYSATPTEDAANEKLITGSVYGGGEAGTVKGDVKVEMTGGYVMHDVYGGGALADSNTNSSSETGTGAKNTKTEVNLYGGLIGGDAYGGGLGRLAVTAVTGVEGVKFTQEEIDDAQEGDDAFGKTTDDWKVEPVDAVEGVTAVEAKVYGDVMVKLGKDDRSTATAFNVNKFSGGAHDGVVKSGRVFGCNNLNGSPQGGVTVTVNKTEKGNTDKTASGKLKSTTASDHTYHVAAVYGGGNLAGKTVGGITYVVINGCDVSIRQVYGGGNAAEVPGTDVLVNGAYEIEQVFGGGNGKDDYTLDGGANWVINPGANVNGNTNTLLLGGLIHEAYGGSNEKGTITGSVVINTDDGQPEDCDTCPLDVEKLVGAGKNADVNGDLIMILGCKPTTKTPLVFGGADNANVNGNVELTITSGTFGKVFGGNNLGGIIKGHIILNIEETGCTPINIDELYLGGNEAAYSIYGYYDSGNTDEETGKKIYLPRTSGSDSHTADSNPATDATHSFPYADPVLNIRSCTHIGKAFGGGWGAGAIMYGSPTVNINQTYGKAYRTVNGSQKYDADATTLGTIGDVYGGGNAADVVGNTTVNIATEPTTIFTSLHDNAGTAANEAQKTVVGANITGNVYGGGSLAYVGQYDVANDHVDAVGNTNVNICAKETGTGESRAWNSVTFSKTAVTIGGHVFGGGAGEATTFQCEKAMVTGETNVRIGNGTVTGNVYGGGEKARVETNSHVTIGYGDGETSTPEITGDVFGAGAGLNTHGYSALVRGNATVIVQGNAVVGGRVYGGGETASVGRFEVVGGLPSRPLSGGTCTVTIQDNATIGANGTDHDVFGACKGVTPAYDSSNYKNNKSMQTYENRGSGAQQDTWDYYPGDNRFVWKYYKTETAYLEFLKTLALTSNTNVSIDDDATVNGSVYGGGQRGVTLGAVVVNMFNGNVNHDVYGGGALADTNTGNWNEKGYVAATALNEGESITDLYTRSGSGTAESPFVYTKITDANTDFDNGTYYRQEATWTNETQKSNLYTTAVNLHGGTISGDVYGGGLGQMAVGTKGETGYVPAIEAKVYGNTIVKLNETPTVTNDVANFPDNCVVKGCIFGCNNLNGSPQGTSTVHIYKTADWEGHGKTATDHLDDIADENHTYNVKAVYGGGNLAAYEPIELTNASTDVIIDGCELTSIRQVYGGGNAASTPGTRVTVNGTYEIEEVFGGGNGKDDIFKNDDQLPNPGANVGYKDYSEYYQEGSTLKVRDKAAYDTKEERMAATDPVTGIVYGTGEAKVDIHGGKIHRVYGGSNTKGNVRNVAVTMLEDASGCPFDVDEAYGGGKSAQMDGTSRLEMACIPGMKNAYGGAEAADIQGDVTLTITNGKFDRVFGGNNVSGTIHGKITVNIEETGCHLITIGQLYGGGNQAPYVGPEILDNENHGTGVFQGPTLNVRSFTSIGDVYGGGYGKTATVTGDTEVNINVCDGKTFNNQTEEENRAAIATNYKYIDKNDNNKIKDVVENPGYKEIQFTEFVRTDDGGFEYETDGSRKTEPKSITVFFPKHEPGEIGGINNVYGGGNAAKVVGNTHVNIGTKTSEVFATPSSDSETARTKPVRGANIVGNVYGGGNKAEVTGNTNVTIGK